MVRAKGHYHTLPWIATPLESEEGHHGHGHEHSEHTSHSSSDEVGKEGVTTGVHPTRPGLNRMPTFREREEATTIELFYDLFFVANLSAFTNNHPIDSSDKVKSYIGFFALLWFTWLQVTLYDVRFAVDSVFERLAKALHLGVMIGFAVIGTQFDTSDTAKNHATFQKFSLILMISRLILLVQYGSLLPWIRQHKKLATPILIHIAVFAIGAIVCLGITFSFDVKNKTSAYLTWYVLAVLEAFAVFATSSNWRTISFKRTNLNERCGLLTLIILGEGVIVLAKSFTYITYGNNYTAGVIGQIISTIVIIYLIYMLYFDQVDAKRFGTIRQQFWALAHFPFHICLVLLLEGGSRFITWVNAIQIVNPIFSDMITVFDGTNITKNVEAITKITDKQFGKIQDSVALTNYPVYDLIAQYANETDSAADSALELGGEITITVTNAVLKYFKISGPSKKKSSLDDLAKPQDVFKDFDSTFHTYDLVYIYMFIAAGFTLILMALLILIAKHRRVAGDYAAVAVRVTFGTILACLAAMVTNQDRQTAFMSSAWILPTIAITIILVVLVDAVLGYVLPAPRDEAEYSVHAHGSE